MNRLMGVALLLGLLYGCSGGGYLPYAPHALSETALSNLVAQASNENGVPPGLVRAVMMAESAGDPSAISLAGAQGLMQLMPGTAAHCGIDPFDPSENA